MVGQRAGALFKYFRDTALIDDILDATRVSVFFIDDLQVVRPVEVGSTDLIREAAAKRGLEVREFELVEAQFRSNRRLMRLRRRPVYEDQCLTESEREGVRGRARQRGPCRLGPRRVCGDGCSTRDHPELEPCRRLVRAPAPGEQVGRAGPRHHRPEVGQLLGWSKATYEHPGSSTPAAAWATAWRAPTSASGRRGRSRRRPSSRTAPGRRATRWATDATWPPTSAPATLPSWSCEPY